MTPSAPISPCLDGMADRDPPYGLIGSLGMARMSLGLSPHAFAKVAEIEPMAAPTITFIRSLNIEMVLSMSGVAAWENVEILAENT